MRGIGNRARAASLTETLRSSLWAIPTGCVVLAVVAAFGALSLDRRFGDRLERMGLPFDAGSEGARATLSSVASSVMTVAGVTFSITVVVLQLASSQFSPRVVRSFLRDRLIQTIIGVYVGTFAFVLLTLRTVRSGEDGQRAFVPVLSVSGAVALGLACMALLIVFLHHIAQSIQVSRIVQGIARETEEAMDELYPEELGDSAPPEEPTPEMIVPVRVEARQSGYLEYVDGDALSELRARCVRLELCVGDYVRVGDLLASLSSDCDGAASEAIHAAMSWFEERTVRQDVRFGVQLIVDVAVRALSPGVNDPTTAVHCLHRMSGLLCRLASRRVPSPVRRTPRGGVVYAPRPSFAEILRLALLPPARYGGQDPSVVRALLDALEAVRARDVGSQHREVLSEIAQFVSGEVERARWPATERDAAIARTRAFLPARARLEAGTPPPT